MTTEFDKISEAANYQHGKLGYVDVNLVTKMTGIPHFVVHNVLIHCGFVESNVHDQYVKSRRLIDDVEKEPCPVCHGAGATTDHHDPCTECGGSGRVEG